jgi:hypothetical protein
MDFQYFGIMKAATQNEKSSFAALLISVAQLRRRALAISLAHLQFIFDLLTRLAARIIDGAELDIGRGRRIHLRLRCNGGSFERAHAAAGFTGRN